MLGLKILVPVLQRAPHQNIARMLDALLGPLLLISEFMDGVQVAFHSTPAMPDRE
jgi:hypothetical protein